jgi:CDP-diglyceride synthetase
MQPLALLQSLVLLTLANGSPVIAKRIFGSRFVRPLDAGFTFVDWRHLFGRSKTIRGILVSILITTASAPIVGPQPTVGTLAAGTAMAGDLLSSFVKRRLDLRSSSRALGLDQVPESLLSLLVCCDVLALTAVDIALGVGIFFVGEVILSRLLYKAHLRDETSSPTYS